MTHYLPSAHLGRPGIGVLSLCLLVQYGSPVLAGTLSEQPASPAASQNVVDLDIDELVKIRVTPFDVATFLDRGYLASNSVSGSRFDAPIQNLPFAIQAFTETFIDDQLPRNIFDIARYSPGVTYRSNDFNEGNANLAIRGFAVSGTKGLIQMLRDGVNGPSILDFTNISRVEVVKGPSSFLYGQVSPGGIINVVTKSPQSDFDASIDVSYGSDDQHRIEADVTGPVAKSVFYRLVGSYDQDTHYWKPYDANSWDVAPSLLWQPNDRVSVLLKYERFHKVESPQLMQKPGLGSYAGIIPTPSDPNLAGVDVPGLPDNWNGLAYSDYRNSDTRNINSWLDIQIDDHWNLRLGYAHQSYVIDAVFTGNFGMANNTTSLQGRRVRGQTYSNQGDTFTVNAVGKFNVEFASLRLLLGAQSVSRSFDDWAGQAPNDPALGSDPTASPLPLWDLSDPSTWDRNTFIPHSMLTENRTDTHIRYTDRSIYAGTTLGFLDERLQVLSGWRLTETKNRLTDNLIAQSEPEFSESQVTPQYGVLFKLTSKLSLFASYAESFVPGSQILLNTDDTTSAASATEGEGYDIGLKADLLDSRISGTLTLFDIQNRNIVNDLASTNESGEVLIYNVQSGEQRSKGVELDITATLSDHWQLYFSYSYMNARISEFSGSDAAILAQDPATLDSAGLENYRNVRRLSNAPLQMSAPHIGNLWTRYDFNKGQWRNLYVAGGVNVVHDQTLLPDGPESSHQSYTLLNMKAGYEWHVSGQWITLDLMGKNLLNEHYRPSQSSRGRPREFLLTLSVVF